MVEYTMQLDSVFSSLADATRRDILRRVAKAELSISEIAKHYDLTFSAVSKHIRVLEKAKLIIKTKRGKEHMILLAPDTLLSAAEYLEWYQQFINARYDSLEKYLKEVR